MGFLCYHYSLKNQLHIDRDFGWFIGGFDQNQRHRHYAIQLSIPLDGDISVITEGITLKTAQPVLIPSLVEHQIISGSQHFLLLMHPGTPLGQFWKSLSSFEAREVLVAPALALQQALKNSHRHPVSAAELNSIILSFLKHPDSSVQVIDERIYRAMAYLERNVDRVTPLEEIAQHCHLSASRFLHLFKDETGITFRRAQLWTKVLHALPLMGKMSFTEIAHHVGFADSAHLSRTFKENFGFGPRDLLKISQSIQV